MTQPDDPYAAQRAAAVSVYTQYEELLYTAYLDMMGIWLQEVEARVLSSAVTTLALMPDPYALFASTPQWTALVERYTEEAVKTVLTGAYRQVLGDGTESLFATRPFVQNFIADMRNNLAGLPDQVFALVGDVIHHGTANGASIPDVQAQLAQLFDATGNPHWAKKAQQVAITTMHTAYAGGTHDAYSVLAEADPETVWVHRWLSTDDLRTRPTHVAADGQVVPWGQPFNVGGALLAFPGDPSGPPEEIIRCRCVELMEVEGEPTAMDNRQTRVTLAAAAVRALADPHDLCSLTACRATGKPGLCKGMHRGQHEPGAPIRQGQDSGVVSRSAEAIKQLDNTAAAIRAQMGNWTPEQRARATRALAAYGRQRSAHQGVVEGQRTLQQQHDQDVERANRDAQRDAREQDRLDKAKKAKAAAKKIAAGSTRRKLKDYQTSTKV